MNYKEIKTALNAEPKFWRQYTTFRGTTYIKATLCYHSITIDHLNNSEYKANVFSRFRRLDFTVTNSTLRRVKEEVLKNLIALYEYKRAIEDPANQVECQKIAAELKKLNHQLDLL